MAPGEQRVLRAAVYADGAWHDAGGATLAVADDATVRLWHPTDAGSGGSPPLRAWEAWLETSGLVQPFAQIRRAVWAPLPDELAAEASVRWRGRVLRQTALRAQCRRSGWQTGFFGDFDGGQEGYATLDLPELEMRALLAIAAEQEDKAVGIADQVRTGSLRIVDDEGFSVRWTDLPARVVSEVLRATEGLVGGA